MPRNRKKQKTRLIFERLEGRRLLAFSAIVGFDVNAFLASDSPNEQPHVGLSQETMEALSAIGAEVTQSWFDGRTREITLQPDADVEASLQFLQSLPGTRYASFDGTITAADFIPNDPQFVFQWALNNSNDVDINAPQAWDQTVGNPATLVAVADSGIDYTHPDLYLAIALNNAEIPTALSTQLVDTNGDGTIDFYDLNSLDALGNVVLDSFNQRFNSSLVTDINATGYIDAGDLITASWRDGIDSDSNGLVDDLTGWDHLDDDSDPIDVWGHGTHVAGIIGARGNDGVGIAGVNWNVRLIPERFIGSVGSVSDMISSIEHAVSQGASVINASWGTFDADQALRDAIEWAGENGVVFVSAAGNHSQNNDNLSSAYYPASFDLDNLISVASVDSDGALSSFSNFGQNTVSLAAPGNNILSTWINGTYVNFSGTSMATPHVTGVVSLLAGLFPTASAEWLVDRVLATVKPLTSLQGATVTGGMVDAFVAVNTPNVAGPRVIVASPRGDVVGPTDRAILTFDSPIETATFTTDDVVINGPGGAISPIAVNRITDLVYEVTFAPQTALGSYSLTVGPLIEDQVGQLMDQDRDGTAGEIQDDAFTFMFEFQPPPQIWIVDDGDAEFSATGGWASYSPDGYASDFLYIQEGDGSEAATWTFSGIAPGQYQVSATWQEYSNRVVDATYKISDGLLEVVRAQVDQRQQPATFLEEGTWWQDLGGIVHVTNQTLTVRLDNLAGPAGRYVIADAVRLERLGDLNLAPQVQVLLDGDLVSQGIETVDFGSTEQGVPIPKTFNIRNVGLEDLTLEQIVLPEGFSVISSFGMTTLATGQSTSFVVQLDANANGVFAGTMQIQSNATSFDFDVSGTVTQIVSAIWILDDGDTGFSATAGWNSYSGVGWDGDFLYRSVGTGSETASWTFTDLQPGEYQISATWVEYSNRATDAAYTILDASTSLGTVTVDQTLTPSSFSEGGRMWQNLAGPYSLVEGTLTVQLSNLAGPAGRYVIADAVRLERVGDLIQGSQIQVLLDGNLVSQGIDTVDFGSTEQGVPIPKTFNVRNVGLADLTLDQIVLPEGFSVVSSFGMTTLATGQSTSFVVQLDANAGGVFAGTMQIQSTTSSFEFDVSGTITNAPNPVLIVDDGDAEFSATAGWSHYSGVGWNGDFLYRSVGSGSESATWTFSDLQPGQYRISATWVEYSNRAIDAAYTILDASTSLGTVTVDQTLTPSSFSEGGRTWQDLGGPYSLVESTLTVQLSDLSAPGRRYVIADAVRLERVGDLNVAPQMQVVVDDELVSAGVTTVDFGSTEQGTPLSRTIVVRNVGLTDLILNQVTLPPGFSLPNGFDSQTLATGQTSSFVVQLDAAEIAAYGGTVQIQSATNTFEFDLAGTVIAAPNPVWITDDGDAGFSATPGWNSYSRVGWNGDFLYRSVGSGSEYATWTFTGLQSGQYRISATWVEYRNRATDAAYSISDTSALLGTATVDQTQSPETFSEGGRMWQDLGGPYSLAEGTLTVQLSDLAGPAGRYVIADAVRLERIGNLILERQAQQSPASRDLARSTALTRVIPTIPIVAEQDDARKFASPAFGDLAPALIPKSATLLVYTDHEANAFYPAPDPMNNPVNDAADQRASADDFFADAHWPNEISIDLEILRERVGRSL